MSIVRQIKYAFNYAKTKGWDKIFVVVDIHNTILKPCYYNKESFQYLPFAKKALQLLSQRKDVCLILWSSTNKTKIETLYKKKFEEDGIKISYVNENPECENTTLACFDKKFYMDVGIDDKFGFNTKKDWFWIYLYLLIKKNMEKLSF